MFVTFYKASFVGAARSHSVEVKAERASAVVTRLQGKHHHARVLLSMINVRRTSIDRHPRTR